MKETVPVTAWSTDHCYVYVLRSVGNNVWEDNRAAARTQLAEETQESVGPKSLLGGVCIYS